jgi:hypothetical protein
MNVVTQNPLDTLPTKDLIYDYSHHDAKTVYDEVYNTLKITGVNYQERVTVFVGKKSTGLLTNSFVRDKLKQMFVDDGWQNVDVNTVDFGTGFVQSRIDMTRPAANSPKQNNADDADNADSLSDLVARSAEQLLTVKQTLIRQKYSRLKGELVELQTLCEHPNTKCTGYANGLTLRVSHCVDCGKDTTE